MEKQSYKVEGIRIPESLSTQQGRSHLLCEQNVHWHCVKPPSLSVIPNQWFPKCDPWTSSFNITWEFGTHSNWAKNHKLWGQGPATCALTSPPSGLGTATPPSMVRFRVWFPGSDPGPSTEELRGLGHATYLPSSSIGCQTGMPRGAWPQYPPHRHWLKAIVHVGPKNSLWGAAGAQETWTVVDLYQIESHISVPKFESWAFHCSLLLNARACVRMRHGRRSFHLLSIVT